MAQLYLAAGVLMGIGTFGAATTDSRWAAAIVFGVAITLGATWYETSLK